MGAIKEFSRELNKALRLLVQSNMDGISVPLVLESELDCWSAGANTSRTLEVGFLNEDNKSKKTICFLPAEVKNVKSTHEPSGPSDRSLSPVSVA